MTLFKQARIVLIALLVAGSMGAAAQDGDQKVRIFRPDSEPHGMTYSEWAQAWWEWAISFPLDESPVTDETGELAGLGQSGNVWFLAGTFGGAAERTVTIPKNKALFFPIVNVIGVFMEEFPGEVPPTDEEFKELLDFVIGFGFSLECTIDGEEIADLDSYRAQSEVSFPLSVPEGGLFPEGTFEPCMGDGFYLMVKPLKPGSHTIHFRGTLDLLGLETEVTYHITVSE